MDKIDNTFQICEINEILKKNNILAKDIKLYQMNNRVVQYLIDNKYIIKVSQSKLDEQTKQERVKLISLVPKIHSSGFITISNRNYYFLITDYVQGSDLYGIVQNLTTDQSKNIGEEIAHFLFELHLITDSSYDIGHYIPTIPKFNRSWKEGHLEYIKYLKDGLSNIDTKLDSKEIISAAFDYINANINCLDYQVGPKLLHNDLHPKNIIVNDGRLQEVIDWECSQFGEADFELVHLFHWCIYPPNPGNRFELLLKTVFEEFMIKMKIPNIEKRLTIYQLEHELNQLIWNGLKQEDDRILRVNGWLSGKIDNLLEKWHLKL